MTSAALAAKELLRRRREDIQSGRLDEALRPTSIEQAFAIQNEIIKQSDDTVGGWKCLLPLDNGNIIVAPIFSQEIQTKSPCYLAADNGLARVEPEVAFVLGQDLPSRSEAYSEQEIDEAIAHCHMALELTKSRFEADSGSDYYEMFADCFINQGMFIGPEIDKATAYDIPRLNIHIRNGGQVESYDGAHPNLSAHKPVYWLINKMSQRGVGFKKGQAIITGSYVGLVDLEFDTTYEIEYEGLDKYQVTFAKVTS
ncbi:hydratase [Alteromonadaceae bacterium M269]|nr:hydratase [Alteromonadaceae bacterium M269]